MTFPHRPFQLARALAAGAAVAALAAPPASARIDPPPTPAFNAGRAAPTAAAGSESGPGNPPVVIVRNVEDGFDWGAAAIGAGGVGALIVLVSAGGFAYTTRHRIGAAR